MVRRVTAYIVGWQIRKNILADDQKALYLYAYEVFLNYLMFMIVAFVIAIVMQAPLSVFIFLASYLPLRSYGGGYHAETNGGCTIASTFLIILACLIEKVLTSDFIFILLPVSLVISGVLIFRFAPVPAKNKPLDEVEMVRYRLKSRQIWMMEAILGILFLFIHINVSGVIAITHTLFSLTFTYGILKRRKE